jgi:hypothetical protein
MSMASMMSWRISGDTSITQHSSGRSGDASGWM